MDKYVIITMNISSVGGAEQYIYNKVSYLKKRGMDVYVFSSLDREIVINGFQEYRKYILPELMYSPTCYSNRHRERTIKKIIEYIDAKEDDLIYIESNNIHQALWAEALATKLNCENIIFNLYETHDYSTEEKEFLRFKLNTHQLAGITDKSVQQMLNEEIKFESWMKFSAYCNNVVDDCENAFSSRLCGDAEFTIGSIGRLEKNFVIHMNEILIDFFSKHSQNRYNMVFIGGSHKKGAKEQIEKMYRNLSNVNLIITGMLYPIPRSLIKDIDVFISTAGSAFVSYQEKRPTIKVHPESAKPVQIMGLTYKDINEVSMYDVLPNTSLLEQMEIAITSKEIHYLNDDYSYKETMNQEFSRQLDYFGKHKYTYFKNVFEVKPISSLKNKLYCLLGHVFGGKGMQCILEAARKTGIV